MSEEKGLLGAIVRFSLRFRGVVISLAVLFFVYGIHAFSQAKYDVFPEFSPPMVVIQAEAPGLSPEQVEVLVTQPVENAVNGVSGVESLRSGSIQGLSLITITFKQSTDIYLARQMIAERLATLVGQLPEGVQQPAMTPLTTSTSVVLVACLTSDRLTLMDLRTIADWTIKQRLLAVPGVAKVSVFGGEVKQFQIQVRPDRLVAYGLSLDDVVDVARRATAVRGAGFIDNANQRIVIQTEAQSLTTAQLARTSLVRGSGADVSVSATLGDIATVVEAPEPLIGASTIMGKPGVSLMISAQYGTNTLEVTQNIERALEELRPSLTSQGVVLHADLFRPANFILTATRNVRSSLLIGGVFVIIVLVLFLFNLRTAAISLTAIPLSLLAAIAVLNYLGYNLNTMTLGGLAIAIGLLVDDAVIVVENIFRRVREQSRSGSRQPALSIVLEAALEVRSAVVYATLVIALVFIPVLTMSGVSGRLFAPLGVAYILATLASLVTAITVTPALCLVFLGKRELKEPSLIHWMHVHYDSLLRRLLHRPRLLIVSVAFLTVAALATLPFLGGGFLPELKEGHYIIHMSAVPGTSLEESLRIGKQVTLELLKLPYVRVVSQRAGRAEKADDTWGTHYSEIDVDLKPSTDDESDLALSDIRRTLAKFPGVNSSVKTFLTERVEETLSGYTASVVINIYGTDLEALDVKAREVAGILTKVMGATEVQVQSPPGTPQLSVRLKKEALDHWGFDAVDALDAVRTAFQGTAVGQVYDGNRVFDVAVILDPRSRKSIVEVGGLPLRNPAGFYVRLRELAEIKQSAGRYVVLHEGARRVQAVTCNVAGRDINSFVADAKEQVASSVKLPPGGYVEFTGSATAQAQSARDLMIHSVLAGVAIILMLSIVIGNARSLLLVLANLPFALVGGVLAVFSIGGGVSIGSMVGFVTLFGITLRNSLMMIAHYDHLVTQEGMVWGPEAVVRGAKERLAPIAMTALVTALGLLPLAIGSGAPGREIEGPMAIVILGGLVTSTVLNLLVLPILALRYGRFEAKRGGG